jgi:hypothetical protein
MNLKDKKTAMIFGGVVLGMVVLIYFLSKRKKSGTEVIEDNPYLIAPQPADLQKDVLDKTKLLKKGSKGPEVIELQTILKKEYKAELGKTGTNKDGIDGDFGSLTEKALLDNLGVKEISLNKLLINK